MFKKIITGIMGLIIGAFAGFVIGAIIGAFIGGAQRAEEISQIGYLIGTPVGAGCGILLALKILAHIDFFRQKK